MAYGVSNATAALATPLEIANRIGNAEADYTDEEFTNYTTIAEVYASTSIPDETEAS
jgi:hypothetical protein